MFEDVKVEKDGIVIPEGYYAFDPKGNVLLNRDGEHYLNTALKSRAKKAYYEQKAKAGKD